LEGFPGFRWPVQGRITSGYGRRKHPILKRVHFHQGIDIAAPTGTPIVAARDGRVTFSGWKKQAGRVVILEHDDGFASVYAHTSENLVEVGDAVRAGEEIARVGRSGLTTGPHLYLEVRRDGQHLNPLKVLTDDVTRVVKQPLPSEGGGLAPVSVTNGTLASVETPEPLPLAESLRPINTWR
jgi:murein DD-endopeptidase MepM/ murein hydrolase activator NlpD